MYIRKSLYFPHLASCNHTPGSWGQIEFWHKLSLFSSVRQNPLLSLCFPSYCSHFRLACQSVSQFTLCFHNVHINKGRSYISVTQANEIPSKLQLRVLFLRNALPKIYAHHFKCTLKMFWGNDFWLFSLIFRFLMIFSYQSYYRFRSDHPSAHQRSFFQLRN